MNEVRPGTSYKINRRRVTDAPRNPEGLDDSSAGGTIEREKTPSTNASTYYGNMRKPP